MMSSILVKAAHVDLRYMEIQIETNDNDKTVSIIRFYNDGCQSV